jgi:FkbM family methyltransferase
MLDVSSQNMVIKSLAMDAQFLGLHRLPILQKLLFVASKYRALLLIALGKSAEVRLKNIAFHTDNISSLGTLQSNILDLYDVVVSANILPSRPRIIDVGANVGQFATAAKLFFPSAQVESFEPDPLVFNQLEVNVRNFEDVKVHELGIGDKNETKEFYVHELSLMSSFKKYPGYHYDASDIKRLKISTLDDQELFKEPIDLLKIDVEGYEANVLEGAKKTLKKAKYLLMEVSLQREQGSDSNLQTLSSVAKLSPGARIVKFGRPLGDPANPTCQDVLIKLGAAS